MMLKFLHCQRSTKIVPSDIREKALFREVGGLMRNCTAFDPQKRYILLQIFVANKNNEMRDFVALLDTGAPATEFSDEALQYLGFLDKISPGVALKNGQQTQKYGKVVLLVLKICSQPVNNLEVYVSHFEKSWGIKALIGLDFFRRFKVTIDYKACQIITEPYA